MNANYIYDIFAFSDYANAPDLNVALAMMKQEKPIPEGLTEKQITEFMGRHYNDLVKAHKTGDRDHFAQVVKACEMEDMARAKEAEEAEED